MNKRMILFLLGRLMQMLSFVLLIPLAVAFLYDESSLYKLAFLGAIGVSFLLGLACTIKKPKNELYYVREGIVVTSLGWILISILGALPFLFSGAIPSFTDAFFETVSGFTTTGSSILVDVEALPHSLVFWRSFMHFIGGMGVLVFTLAIVPEASPQSIHLMQAEMPGPEFSKIRSRVRSVAQVLYLIYAAMTLVCIVVFIVLGMSPFDACIHAFGSAGTGGFSNYNDSVAHFGSAKLEYAIGIAMFLFGVNFNLYYFLLVKEPGSFFKSEELRAYVGIVIGATILLAISIIGYSEDNIRDAFFTVTTIITTTGFGTADFTKWPMFSQLIILALMFIGGSAGSTAGGFKVSRVIGIVRIARSYITKALTPNRIKPVHWEGATMSEQIQIALGGYLALYVLSFFVILTIVSFENRDFTTTFSAVAGTFNNVGPALGELGPKSNFSSLTDLSKWALSIGMIAGRLEIAPLLILFLPATWLRK